MNRLSLALCITLLTGCAIHPRVTPVNALASPKA
jgi:hypothetical protein